MFAHPSFDKIEIMWNKTKTSINKNFATIIQFKALVPNGDFFSINIGDVIKPPKVSVICGTHYARPRLNRQVHIKGANCSIGLSCLNSSISKPKKFLECGSRF